MVRNIIVRERMGSSESGTMSSLVKRVVGKRGYDDALNQFSRRINRKLETLKGNTALIWAAMRGHLDVARELLRHGAETRTKNYSGETALSEARKRKHVHIVKAIEAEYD